jgi:hypothetical protein
MSPLSASQVLKISFATFTARITIRSERELTVEIVARDNLGFSDTVEYAAVAVRDDLVDVPHRPKSSARHLGVDHVPVPPRTSPPKRS